MAMISPNLQFHPALHPDSLNPQTAVSEVLCPTEKTSVTHFLFYITVIRFCFISFDKITSISQSCSSDKTFFRKQRCCYGRASGGPDPPRKVTLPPQLKSTDTLKLQLTVIH